MKTYPTEHILRYRYKTNAYIALLSESRYFDTNISDSCRNDILKNIVDLSNLVCEGKAEYPYLLVKKYQLNEQAGIGGSIKAAKEAMVAARIARETQAAAEAAKAAETAKAAAGTAKAAETAAPTRIPVLPKQIGQPSTPMRGEALKTQAMDYIQMQALQHAQQGLRGEDLASMVRENLKNNPKFAELGDESSAVEKAAEQILKAAEETAAAMAKGEQINPVSLVKAGESKLGPEDAKLPREDILSYGAGLRAEREKLGELERIAKIDVEAEPRIDWSGSLGMPETDISKTIRRAEKQAKQTKSAGEEALKQIAPQSADVANELKKLVYELNRRKAQGEMFTPEEIEAYKKMIGDLTSYRENYSKASTTNNPETP